MKNKICNIFIEIVDKRDHWTNLIRNAKRYDYHEKYKYNIVYFDIYKQKILTLEISFVDCKWGMLFKMSIKNELSYLQTATSFELAEEFDQAMLFIHNRQLKKHALMDFM